MSKDVEAFLSGKKPPEKIPQPAQPPVKSKKRQYKERECPYCHIHVRNLGNHITLKHGSEAQAKKEHPPQAELTKVDLLGGGSPMPETQGQFKITYYCQNCHAELKRGETECWKCHDTLVWEGVE